MFIGQASPQQCASANKSMESNTRRLQDAPLGSDHAHGNNSQGPTDTNLQNLQSGVMARLAVQKEQDRQVLRERACITAPTLAVINAAAQDGSSSGRMLVPHAGGCNVCSKLQLDLAEKDAAYQALTLRLEAEEVQRCELEDMLESSEETRWGLVQELGDRERACHTLAEQLADERRKCTSLQVELSGSVKDSSTWTLQRLQSVSSASRAEVHNRQPAADAILPRDSDRADHLQSIGSAPAAAVHQPSVKMFDMVLVDDVTGVDIGACCALEEALAAEAELIDQAEEKAKQGGIDEPCDQARGTSGVGRSAGGSVAQAGHLAHDEISVEGEKFVVLGGACDVPQSLSEWLLVDHCEVDATGPSSAELAAAGEGLHIDVQMSRWGSLPEVVQQWLSGLTLSDCEGLNIDVELESWGELPEAVQQWVAGMQLSQQGDFVYGHPAPQELEDVCSADSCSELYQPLTHQMEMQQHQQAKTLCSSDLQVMGSMHRLALDSDTVVADGTQHCCGSTLCGSDIGNMLHDSDDDRSMQDDDSAISSSWTLLNRPALIEAVAQV